MLGEDKNIKDSSLDLDLTIKDSNFPISYSKTNKLIIALYMVTDILDNSEPLRNKLRTLGMEIVSDMHMVEQNRSRHTASLILKKTQEIASFLEIAYTVNLISEMNCNILKKEFFKLSQSIREYGQVKSDWIEEFLIDSIPETSQEKIAFNGSSIADTRSHSIGHDKSNRLQQGGTRIGVQKGDTLMKALSDKTSAFMKDDNKYKNSFDVLKKQRQDEVLHIVKGSNVGFTISDIKAKAKGLPLQAKALAACGEKTLQRELVSMVKNGVLYKTGEKRWSRYFVKN